MKQGALHGIKVLDLSRVLAGPWATQMLGDLGADVVKVERPEGGDDTRAWGPPWLERDELQSGPMSAYFTCANRNKRSIAVDLSSADGQALIRRLATQADVLVENFKVGGLAQYALDYESLKVSHPGLIYCSITGFGQAGPYAHRPGYDFLIQGMCGLMSVTGQADHAPGGGPMKVGVALVDVMTGLYASNAILAALQYRHRTGEGQHIDVALFDVQVAALANQAANHLVGGQVPQRMGNAHPNIVPYQDFPTADGHMILTVGNDSQFERLCEVLEHPHWAADDRFRTNAARVRHRDILVALLQTETVKRSTGQWIRALESAGVPCGPINDIAQVFSDPHALARGLHVQIPAAEGTVSTVRNPLRLSASPVTHAVPPPALGAHTQEVIRDWLQRPSTQP